MASLILLNSKSLLAVLLLVAIRHNNTQNQLQFAEPLVALSQDQMFVLTLATPLLLPQMQLPTPVLNLLHNLPQVPLLALAHRLPYQKLPTVCLNSKQRNKDFLVRMKSRLLTKVTDLSLLIQASLH